MSYTIAKRYAVLLSLIFSFSLFADYSEPMPIERLKQIIFEGQSSASFDLSNHELETRYRDREVDSTCTRRVPYTDRECRNERDYRRECRWVPGEKRCYQKKERICRRERRYRRECRREPGKRICRTVPGKEKCRYRDGKRICRREPARRVCRTEPGRRICRDVPYYERVCRTEYRRVCEREPRRQVCRDVPYDRYVCRDVTKYRDEQYACKKIIREAYDFVTMRQEMNCLLEFVNAPQMDVRPEFNFRLNKRGKLKIEATNLPEKTIAVVKKNVSVIDSSERLTRKQADIKVRFSKERKLLSPFNRGIDQIRLESNQLSFVIGRVNQTNSVRLAVEISKPESSAYKRAFILSDTDITLKNLGKKRGTKVTVDLGNFDTEYERRDQALTLNIDLGLKKNLKVIGNTELNTSVQSETIISAK